MVQVVASITIKAEYKATFISHFKDNVPHVLKEKGCIEYQPAIDLQTELPSQVTNDRVITVIEKWETLEHLYAHITAPHMISYKEKVKGMVLSVELKVLQNA